MRAQTRRVVRGYFEAWTAGDLGGARSFLADELDCEGSIDRFRTADDFIQSLGAFVPLLTETRLLAEAYESSSAALLYDCVTNSAAGTIRTSEHLHVVDGRIHWIRIVFDPGPLRWIAAED